MSMDYQQELRVALEAVRSAARLCSSVQAEITTDVLEKEDRSPVTVADFGSQAAICRSLGQSFPDDPVIAEEGADELRNGENAAFLASIGEKLRGIDIDGSGEEICRWIDRGAAEEFSSRFWTLDPIDGTKGFLRGDQYAIALALIVDGRIDLAVLGCPNLPVVPDAKEPVGTLFYAVRGKGAWSIPLDEGQDESPVRVSPADDPAQSRFCEPFESGHTSHGRAAQVAETLGITKTPLRLDSQAKYAVVARGEAEIYMRLPKKSGYVEKIWDHAAGVLLVEEAGGRVTDVTGKPLDFSRGAGLSGNQGVVVTNGGLHERVIAALEQTVADG